MSKPRDNSDQIFWGLFLLAAGTILLLSRLGVMNISWTMRHYWPLIVIIVGLSHIFHRRTIWSGLWIVAVGAWLQMVTLHIYGFTYRSSWPFLLVILGAGIIMRTIADAARRRDVEEGDHHV
ncbi:MAG TPA: DUF5668 domain-containing protein [Thermoanaerobaculia bacterium]|jgi:uncharacterized protein (DUF58 family)|nr:DUF5668 domain-containing protein [Thermoanaerobaculia bacterium]